VGLTEQLRVSEGDRRGVADQLQQVEVLP